MSVTTYQSKNDRIKRRKRNMYGYFVVLPLTLIVFYFIMTEDNAKPFRVVNSVISSFTSYDVDSNRVKKVIEQPNDVLKPHIQPLNPAPKVEDIKMLSSLSNYHTVVETSEGYVYGMFLRFSSRTGRSLKNKDGKYIKGYIAWKEVCKFNATSSHLNRIYLFNSQAQKFMHAVGDLTRYTPKTFASDLEDYSFEIYEERVLDGSGPFASKKCRVIKSSIVNKADF
ncbi:MAG: hypothetical protein CFH44_00716 [Proteobacteria bacterium]|nr:MAG: hypothetical protein CFH44_00716 [Pseudomonadota bacterium]|tara:strand:- start:233 stop:907 length:675 start_codon:yes stop_codon:yes gene_type:complete